MYKGFFRHFTLYTFKKYEYEIDIRDYANFENLSMRESHFKSSHEIRFKLDGNTVNRDQE